MYYAMRETAFLPDRQALCERLRVDEDIRGEFYGMLDAAGAIARPKYLICEKPVNGIAGDRVTVDKTEFQSALLARKLAPFRTVYISLATCGRELSDWAEALTDPLETFWAEEIKLAALGDAIAARQSCFREELGISHPAAMQPGSLPEWPLAEQKKLFSLLGAETAGVTLTESCLMLPTKSVSALFFPIDSDYCNCRLCRRTDCPNRRAEFDEAAAMQTDMTGACVTK